MIKKNSSLINLYLIGLITSLDNIELVLQYFWRNKQTKPFKTTLKNWRVSVFLCETARLCTEPRNLTEKNNCATDPHANPKYHEQHYFGKNSSLIHFLCHIMYNPRLRAMCDCLHTNIKLYGVFILYFSSTPPSRLKEIIRHSLAWILATLTFEMALSG